MGRNTRTIIYDFRGALAPPAVASREGIWCSQITAAGGSPTVKSVSGGPLELALTATSEVQNITLYTGDILPFAIDEIRKVWFVAKISDTLAAAVRAVVGLASARNADPDAIATSAWFAVEGSNALNVETDDGTTDKNDISSGFSLDASAYRELVIDFSEGLVSKSPPALSVGGKANVQFYVGNTNGSRRRVAQNTAFDMSAATGNLQLFAQIQKTTGTAVGTLSILEAGIELKLPA
jgi:hypothetical protein